MVEKRNRHDHIKQKNWAESELKLILNLTFLNRKKTDDRTKVATPNYLARALLLGRKDALFFI